MEIKQIQEKDLEEIAKLPSSKCSTCETWGDCIGGCPLIWLKFNPKEELK